MSLFNIEGRRRIESCGSAEPRASVDSGDSVLRGGSFRSERISGNFSRRISNTSDVTDDAASIVSAPAGPMFPK